MNPGLPRWIYVPAALGAWFVVLPLIAVAAKVDWSRFLELISSESSVIALVLSLKTAAASTVLCVLLGCRWHWSWRAAGRAWCAGPAR